MNKYTATLYLFAIITLQLVLADSDLYTTEVNFEGDRLYQQFETSYIQTINYSKSKGLRAATVGAADLT